MRDFVKTMSSHSFLMNCKFSNKRFTFDHIVAQTICIELAGGPTSIRDADLNRMYEEQIGFDPQGPIAKKVRKGTMLY